MKTNKSIYKLVLISVFAALAFVGTCIHIPLPTGGMIHLGNFVVILSALLCGGLIGGISGGIGCGLYDLILYGSWDGFFKYLILKFVMGMIAGYLFRWTLNKRENFHPARVLFICGAVIILLTSGVLALFFNDLITISYANPTGYIILVCTLSYALGLFMIVFSLFSIKKTYIHKILLMVITVTTVVNLVLEFISKYILSITLNGLTSEAGLVRAYSTMPSCILTGVVSVILISLIYIPLYKATRHMNIIDDIAIEEK